MKQRKPYTQTASKHMTLAQLKRIQQDNYVGANGVDYCPFELEARIVEIETKQAMDMVSNFKKHNNDRAKYMQINDKLAVKPAPQKIQFIIKQTKTMFTLSTTYGMAV